MPRRIAIFSDIHANEIALQKCLADARKRNADEFWCLGDLVGINYDPVGTLKLARKEFGDRFIPGNHDLGVMSVGRIPVDVLLPPLDPQLPAREPTQLVWALHRLELQADPSIWNWCEDKFKTSPETQKQVLDYGKIRILMSHSSQPDFTKYERPDKHDLHEKVFKQMWQDQTELDFATRPIPEVTIFICGHTHIPMVFYSKIQTAIPAPLSFNFAFDDEKEGNTEAWIQAERGMYLINTGSVGQPRDGSMSPCYLMLEINEDSLHYQFCRPTSVYDSALEEFKNLYNKYNNWQPPAQSQPWLSALAMRVQLRKALHDLATINWLHHQLMKCQEDLDAPDPQLELTIKEIERYLEDELRSGEDWSNDARLIFAKYIQIPWGALIKATYEVNVEIYAGARGDYSDGLNRVYERDRSRGYKVRKDIISHGTPAEAPIPEELETTDVSTSAKPGSVTTNLTPVSADNPIDSGSTPAVSSNNIPQKDVPKAKPKWGASKNNRKGKK